MNSSSPNRRVASNLLLQGGILYRNPIVEFAPDGEILSVERCEMGSEDRLDRSPHTEFYSGIMVAGFVNTHCHLELSYLRGAIEPGGGFARFASRIGEVRGSFSDEERVRAISRAEAEMLREGVAAVGDIVNGDSTFASKSRSDIMYRNFAELFGLRTNDTSAVDPLLQQPLTSATPHSTYSLNDHIFRHIAHNGDAAPLSIHFMESPAEHELYIGEGRLAEWYARAGFECDFLHYGSPAERLVASVPADRSVILVHNCCVTQRDIDIIMSHFTAPVYWVLCPRSNSYISDLRPPTELLRRNSLNICIGTDSLASNSSLSIIEELKLLNNTPLAERLDWATRVGAEALGFNHLGEIEVGRRPGINILSGIDYTSLQLTDSTTLRRII
ncbi:MAG: amidohydrolase family protein [Rikenellaceae bacterium]